MRLIDADALMEQLGITEECSDCVNQMGAFCHKSSDFVNACEAICDAPTIDPVKHGRWIMKGTAYGCSLCGEGVIHPFHNYCPNCGARMEVEE